MVSFCTSCIESGNSCHECEIKWVKQERDPHICSICKSKTKQNISTEALKIYNIRNENNRERSVTRERNIGNLNGRTAALLRTIHLNSIENGDMNFENGEIENQNYQDIQPLEILIIICNIEEITFNDFSNPKKCVGWVI